MTALAETRLRFHDTKIERALRELREARMIAAHSPSSETKRVEDAAEDRLNDLIERRAKLAQADE